MRGVRSGVATQIAQDESQALYVHCYGHSLNLACQDTIREIKPLKHALDTAFVKRNAGFKRIHAEMACH